MRSPLSGLAPARSRLVVVLLGILAVALVALIGTLTVTELNRVLLRTSHVWAR